MKTQETALRAVYDDQLSTFQALLQKSFTVHERNMMLGIEI